MLLAVAASVALGEFAIPLADVIRSLAGAGDRATDYIVLELRLPRALTGLLAGAAFGLAGAAFQDLARNPLVAPDVVGVSGGASLAGVFLLVTARLHRRGLGPGRRARRGAAGRRSRSTSSRGARACTATGSCSSGSASRPSPTPASTTC